MLPSHVVLTAHFVTECKSPTQASTDIKHIQREGPENHISASILEY